MEKLPKDQGMWNAIAMFAFIIIFVLVFDMLTEGFGRHMRVLYGLTAFDITIMALAVFRLIRLVSYDKIFAFVRNVFMDEHADGYVKPKGGFRRLVAELLECMWCTGLWAALFVAAAYLSSGIGYFLVLVLALSAIGSFLQNVSKAVAGIVERR